jgi:ferredoxin-like protein FixX
MSTGAVTEALNVSIKDAPDLKTLAVLFIDMTPPRDFVAILRAVLAKLLELEAGSTVNELLTIYRAYAANLLINNIKLSVAELGQLLDAYPKIAAEVAAYHIASGHMHTICPLQTEALMVVLSRFCPALLQELKFEVDECTECAAFEMLCHALQHEHTNDTLWLIEVFLVKFFGQWSKDKQGAVLRLLVHSEKLLVAALDTGAATLTDVLAQTQGIIMLAIVHNTYHVLVARSLCLRFLEKSIVLAALGRNPAEFNRVAATLHITPVYLKYLSMQAAFDGNFDVLQTLLEFKPNLDHLAIIYAALANCHVDFVKSAIEIAEFGDAAKKDAVSFVSVLFKHDEVAALDFANKHLQCVEVGIWMSTGLSHESWLNRKNSIALSR